jgi:hypothetical protein
VHAPNPFGPGPHLERRARPVCRPRRRGPSKCPATARDAPLAGTSQHAVPPPTSAACLLAGTREGRVAPTHRVTGAPRMIAARSQSRARARRRRGAAPCPTDLARCLQWRRLLSKCISAAAPHYISTRRRTLQAPITPDQTG